MPLLRSVRTPAAQASEVLRNGNRSKLYPYISVRSNILALNGSPLHRTIFGFAINANPTIIGRKMTEIIRADFAEDTSCSFGGIFITCFSLCCIAWCAVCQRTVSCHFAANANSQDTVLGLFKTLAYIVTQKVTSYAILYVRHA